jgi:hypothetical protein
VTYWSELHVPRGTNPLRRAALTTLLALVAGACTLSQATFSLAPVATATPPASAPPPASAAPSPEPTTAPTAPAPALADVPHFTAGATVTTNAPGLRVRSRAGVDQRVITSLGVDAKLLIGLGPVFIDDVGWYLVRDADPDEPSFIEGWVAAGFEPDPYLIPASFAVADNPYLAGYAHDASGEYGPVFLPDDGAVTVRWIAAALGPDGCSFAVDLRAGSGGAIPAIRTTVGTYPAPGDLYGQFFREHPDLRGDIFVTVTSGCSWALTFVRDPAATPSPLPSG